ncbi:hypothetical protein EGW08_020598, partial [Elysia chlorotica]
GKLELRGPEDGAQLIGEEVVFVCDLADTDSHTGTVSQPYTITWTFTPHNMDAVSTIMTATHQGQQQFMTLTPDPVKYRDTGGPHLRVYDLLLSDAGLYRCQSNLTGETASAQLYVVGYPVCHNNKPDVYYNENISLDCTVQYGGSRHPTVRWRFGELVMNSTTESQDNATVLHERLILEASESIRGRIYHCQVYYPGFRTVECLALPAIQVYSHAKVVALHVFPVTRDNQFRRGSALLIKCIGTGYPVPTYSWNFTPAGSDVTQKLTTLGNTVNIKDFSEEHVGVYECVVTNEIVVKLGDKARPGAETKVETFRDTRSTNITITDELSAEPEVNRLENAAYVVRSEQRGPGPTVADTRMKFSPYAIGAVTSAGLAVLLIVIIVLMSMRMRKRENRMREKIARAHDENLDDQEVELLDESTQPNTEYLPTEYSRLKMSWEIPRKDVRLLEQIGQGAFVEVWKGRMRRSPGSTEVMRVIIKKLQGEASDKERHFFSAELEVMKMLPAHANVIRLVGSYTANEPWLMMMELANEGTLQQFLQRHRPGHQTVLIGRGDKPSVSMSKRQSLTSQKLLALAAQVASGLDHLEKFKLIYYRLRSCKILVAKGGICKLSGFGFPNEMADRNQYETNSLPVRWAAPESLHNGVFNTKTDTWSYGIVVWEILHFGTTPYPTMGPHEVTESVHTGFRMPKPQHCSSELYELLLRCWHTIPEERPSYQEILEVLSHLVINAEVHIDFSSLPDHLLSLDTGDTHAAF